MSDEHAEPLTEAPAPPANPTEEQALKFVQEWLKFHSMGIFPVAIGKKTGEASNIIDVMPDSHVPGLKILKLK